MWIAKFILTLTNRSKKRCSRSRSSFFITCCCITRAHWSCYIPTPPWPMNDWRGTMASRVFTEITFGLVPLGPAHSRGGLLTQPGLLAMNSDGKDSHPLKRGIWLLESFLNDPPPPPPPAVPEIDLSDPEIAKLSLKQRMEDHRNDPACYSCHAKIDPWGIAFEEFNAVGSFRTEIQGKPVDSTSQLFNGQTLDGVDGLKRYLLQNRQDQFVRALVYKMTTYALGRPLRFSDRASIEEITAKVRQQGDGLATIVRLITTSNLFKD